MASSHTQFLLSKEVTDKILWSMHEGLIVFNSDDEIQTINEATLRILDLREDALLKKSVVDVFSDRKEGYNFLILLETEKQLNQKDYIFRKGDGKKIHCLLSAWMVQDTAEGELLKVIVFHDVTERKQAELQAAHYAERLEKTVAELNQFAYIVSHDLKAPLRAIANLSQWLYEDLEGTLTDDNKKNLDTLKNRVMRMEALINDILEYSKIGRIKVESEMVDTGALLSDVLDLLSPASHIKINLPAGLPVVPAPKIMLHQVFANLISNAIKYNDKKEPVINISVEDKDEFYQFGVKDNGPGIPQQYQEKVFQIFQTLHKTDKIESTGIGLTIVKRIIEEQGGRIWIKSESGNGTEFLFLWPKHLKEDVMAT